MAEKPKRETKLLETTKNFEEIKILKEDLLKSYLRIEDLEKENKILQEEKRVLEERYKKEKIMPILDNVLIQNILNTYLKQLGKFRSQELEIMKRTDADRMCISHGDGDGVCGSALVKRYLPSKPDMKFFYLLQRERHLIKELNPAKELVCIDLLINDEIAEHLLRLKHNGVKVSWIDHHKDISISKDKLEALGESFIWSETSSAAALVQKHFGVEDPIASRIVLIANGCDSNVKIPADVLRDVAIIKNLEKVYVLEEVADELSRKGTIEDKTLIKQADAVKVLVTYCEKIIKEKLFYADKNFEIYDLSKLQVPVIGEDEIAYRFVRESGKDTFIFKKGKNNNLLKGRARHAEEVFRKVAEAFNGNYYTLGNRRGGCRTSSDVSIKQIKDFLVKLYEEHETKRNVYRLIASPLLNQKECA